MTERPSVPRYAPARSLPPYAHRPGETPHPTRNPAGHSFGLAEPIHEGEFVPAAWRTAEEHLFAVDLFNAGYYWEAHEAWEGLWRRAQGTPKLLLHGLIQAAAVLLKHAQRMPDSVRTLGPSALAKLDGVLADLPPDAPFLLGVNVRAMRNDFARFIEPVLNDAPHAFDAGGDPPKIVLGVE